jgi:hypothetical protein
MTPDEMARELEWARLMERTPMQGPPVYRALLEEHERADRLAAEQEAHNDT